MDPNYQEKWEKYFGAGTKPHYFVNAPGRVNLIGEHVDHQDYSVLPCAIQPSIRAYVRAVVNPTRELPALKLAHYESKFETREFPKLADIVIKQHHWTNYVLAAYMGVVEYLCLKKPHDVGTTHDVAGGITEHEDKQAGATSPTIYSIQMLFTGDVPEAAGLSSSSALVCCAAVAFDFVNGKRLIDAPVLADVTACCERYVGTAGGGMDQAAILCCQEGFAAHIGFNPLTLEQVKLPSEIAVVVANTGREAPKAVSAAKMYNKRVFELRAACLQMIKKVNPEAAATLSGPEVVALGLRTVLHKYLKISEKEALEKLGDYLHDKSYSKGDLDEILGEERRQFLLEKRCGVDVWTKNDSFYLYQRIRHVLTETLRVSRFVELCKTHVKEGKETPKEVLKEMGELINGSGDSLIGDFDAGCKEICEMQDLGRKNGALGVRLTGAGWGGATVHLIMKEDTEKYLEVIKNGYYKPYITGEKKADPPLEFLPKSVDDVSGALFATTPGPAAYAKKI